MRDNDNMKITVNDDFPVKNNNTNEFLPDNAAVELDDPTPVTEKQVVVRKKRTRNVVS